MANDLVPNADFSWLGNIGKIYEQARDKDALSALGEGLAAGTLDYKQAAGKAAKTGNLDLTMSLLKLGREQEASQQFNKLITPMLGGGAAAPTGTAPVSAPAGDTTGRIIQAESGGNPTARNPNSSAAGPGQFIDSTWLATIKQARPDIAAGKTDAQLLALRTDPKQADLSREMTSAYAQQNAGILANAGHQVTPGTTYLAHFVGPGGATRVLGADPATPVSSLLAPEAIAANPMLRGMTAGDLRNWADKKMGGPVAISSSGGPARPDARNVYPSDAVLLPQQGQGQQPFQVAQAQPAPDQTALQAPQAQPAQAQPPAQPGNVFTAPSITNSPAGKQQIPILAAAMSNIGLSQPQREMAKTLLEHHLKSSDYTEDEKKYWRTYVPQEFAAGQQPKRFNDWMIEQKRASAVTSGESTFETELSKINAKRFGKFLDNGEVAQRRKVDIDSLREISNRIGSQGAGVSFKELVGPYAQALGIDVKDLSDIQAYTSIINRIAPQSRVEGAGSTSDIEYKGMLKAAPGLANDPAARTAVIDTMDAIAQREMAEGDIAARLAAREIDQKQAHQELRKLPDPMTAFKEWRKANPEAYRRGLSTSAQAQKPETPQSVVPETVRSKPLQQQMKDAPEGSIMNFGNGVRKIKQGGNWVDVK